MKYSLYDVGMKCIVGRGYTLEQAEQLKKEFEEFHAAVLEIKPEETIH